MEVGEKMAERKIAKANRGFKGIWIPSHLWLDEDLTMQEILFLVEIDSLDISNQGCFASNKHFSDFFGLSTRRCSQIINSLKEKEFVSVELIVNDKKQIEKRIIRVSRKFLGGYQENFHTPIEGKFSGSNTGFSNTKDKRHKRVYDESSSYLKAASYFKNLASENFEFQKQPDIQKWADEIRKLVELDKQPLSVVKEVMDWSQQDEFWFKNIRSATKLRKQFETLLLQMKAKQPKVKSQSQSENINIKELGKLFGEGHD